MSRNAFVALVNKRAGGNVGSSLLAKFKEELDEGRVYDLSDGGPLRALQEHSQTDNLRIIGKPFLLSKLYLCYGIYGSIYHQYIPNTSLLIHSHIWKFVDNRSCHQ